MAGESRTTTDHDEIRRWVEERGGQPATVKRTAENGEPGLLRIDFPGYSGEQSLEPITWEEFFQKFDEKNLAFLYQEETAGGDESRFVKFVSRETADTIEEDKEERQEKRSEKRRTASRMKAKSKTAARSKPKAVSRTAANKKSATAAKKTAGNRKRTQSKSANKKKPAARTKAAPQKSRASKSSSRSRNTRTKGKKNARKR